MTRFLSGVLLVLLSSGNVWAGVFSSEPSTDFKNLRVMIAAGGASIKHSFTVGKMTKLYEAESSTSWEKDGNDWIFRVKKVDKMTRERTDLAFLFRQIEKEYALIGRWIVDGKDLSAPAAAQTLNALEMAIGEKVSSTETADTITQPAPGSKAKGVGAQVAPVVKTAKSTGPSPAEAAKREEEERSAKAAAAEDTTRKQLIDALAGRYENRSGKDQGELIIEIVGGDSIKIGYVKPNQCEIKELVVPLSYRPGPGGEQGVFSASAKQGECEINLNRLGMNRSLQVMSVSIDTSGSCKEVCKERGANILGMYIKKP